MYSMTPRENSETDAIHQDVALARWENEGGAFMALAGSPTRNGRPAEGMSRFNQHKTVFRQNRMNETVVTR
jgi:hypothetical protein